MFRVWCSQSTKVTCLYDRLGRSTVQRALAKTDDTTYANAEGVGGDVVLEESRTGYHPASGKVLLTHRVSRHHDYGLTAGALDSNADGDALIVTATDLVGRAQITAMWYDGWDRVTDRVQLGTNGGSTYDRGGAGSPPSSGPTALRWITTYDTFGNADSTTDPMGALATAEFDAAGRKVKTVGNYDDGAADSSQPDRDRIVTTVYDKGRVVSVTLTKGFANDDQTTEYTYDTDATGSIIKRKNLLTKIVYAQQVTSQPDTDRTVAYTYNALSEVMETKDCIGNVIESTYDKLGRVTAREIGALVSGDGTVHRIETLYNARGMVQAVRQKNSSSDVLDEIEYTYDDWGNLVMLEADPDGVIGAGGETATAQTWTYALNTSSGGWRNMKLTEYALLPTDIVVTPDYGSSGSIEDLVGRTATLTDQYSTPIAGYAYLGAAMVVGVELPEPSMQQQVYAVAAARITARTWTASTGPSSTTG